MRNFSSTYIFSKQNSFVSRDEIDILRIRSENFFRNAERLLEEGVYDLAAFSLQQAVELFLKYKLFLLLGEYPRTHSIKRLLREIGKTVGKEEDIEAFLSENIDRISNLENAYITSRYIPTEFERKEVENMLEVARRIIKFVEAL